LSVRNDRIRRLASVAALAVWGAACQNAGESRVLGITATGTVSGLAYLDRNGNRVFDPGDTTLANLGVRLVAQGTRDTTARASSGAAGTFHFSGVPVGSYVLAVDTTSTLGDTIRVTRVDTSAVTLRPGDTLLVRIAVGYPQVSVAQARALAPGRKAFVVGVALNTRGIFGDTTVNLADSTGAMRMTAVRTVTVATGDSVRAFGTRASRDGQPTLNQVTVFTLAFDADTPIETITTGTAATADGGRLDAALVRLLNARVQDTATVQGNRSLTVNDATGALEVRLDSIAGFRAPALAGDTVGARLDVVGLLVPVGAANWRVKPRSPSDVVQR